MLALSPQSREARPRPVISQADLSAARPRRTPLCAAIRWSRLTTVPPPWARPLIQPALLPADPPLLFFPFALLFNKYFLSSCCVVSTVPPPGTRQRVQSAPSPQQLPGCPFLPPEPRALQPPPKSLERTCLHCRALVTGLCERGQASGNTSARSAAGKGASPSIVPKPHIKQPPCHVAESISSLQEKAVAT